MSSTAPIARRGSRRQEPAAIIDCDMHPSMHSRSRSRTRSCRSAGRSICSTYGSHLRTPYIATTPYPRSSPLIARRDAWPPTGGPPGSDLDFMRKQHLDPLDVEFGILQVLDLFIFSQQNLEFGAAIQRAINDWQLEFWSRPRAAAEGLDPRRPGRHGARDRRDRALRGDRPLRPDQRLPARQRAARAAPLLADLCARAGAAGLPLGIHVGGYGGHAPTGGGWPSFYDEEHQSQRAHDGGAAHQPRASKAFRSASPS